MLYVVNDLHGAKKLIDATTQAISRMRPGDRLVVNGDGAGAHGPIMDQIVRVLDETLRPLAEAADKQGVKLFYVPGDGGIVPDYYLVEDTGVERTINPDMRFYQKLAYDGYFDALGVEYVPYVKALPNGVLLLSTHLLDLDEAQIDSLFKSTGIYGIWYSKVLVHYPPAIAPVGGAFYFWTPNKSDISRCKMLGKILPKLQLTDDAMVYFGHIHLDVNDTRMDRYPSSMTFLTHGFGGCTWVKPGAVVRV